eukprot:Transcript_4303.p1 GENE.Transcript_4303~~Transcript_4303.p1  ORF type:complete len:393 (+),score=140.73 Transcript_4303:215-1393(+)
MSGAAGRTRSSAATAAVSATVPPPPRTFAEGRDARNRAKRDGGASFEVCGGYMFADLFNSPRYMITTASGESQPLPVWRRFYELTRVLTHEVKFAAVVPAARPYAWPFTVRINATSRKDVLEPPRGVLLEAGGVAATSATILAAADAAAEAALVDLSASMRPEVKPSAAVAGMGGQPLDVLVVRLHLDAVTVLRVLREEHEDDEDYRVVLLDELTRLCAKGAEQHRRAPKADSKAEWDALMLDVLAQGDNGGPYFSQDAAKITVALEELATYLLAWVESEGFAPPRPFERMHELYSAPLRKVIECCWQLKNFDNRDRPASKKAKAKVVRRGKSRAYYASHFSKEAQEGAEEEEEEPWSGLLVAPPGHHRQRGRGGGPAAQRRGARRADPRAP